MLGNGKKRDMERLALWRDRYQRNKNAYEIELRKMDRREALYQGTKEIQPAQGAANARPASLVRNIVAEMIEAQVSSAIPQPKVTAMHEGDEDLAQIVEDMLRNELARLPMPYNNDQEERTVLIQGGALTHIEWDSTQRTHTTSGELYLGQIHPKAFIPQAGVFTDIEDMDYCFVDIPQTKRYIRDRYQVDVDGVSEERPEARGQDAESGNEEDLVTQHVAYYRNQAGGIGLFSWAGDQVLEDMEDYQARRASICDKCGQVGDGERCQYCGSTKFHRGAQDYEELGHDIRLSNGKTIPAMTAQMVPMDWPSDEELEALGPDAVSQLAGRMPTAVMQQSPTNIPYYKPDVFPVVLRKNVSVFGRLLGDSDADAIEAQQESIKKIETKLVDKIFKGGSVLTVGKDTKLDTSDKELRLLRLDNVAEKSMIDVLNLQPNVVSDFDFLHQMYEEAKQRTGVTDSFLGRKDPTATSGVAKEFAARQSAGRLESKRVMKEAYYARLYKVMFQFMLAYADEPRTVVSTDSQGHTKYAEFNRYDFLKRDANGEWYWEDRFLFGVDPSASLSQDREALWQECRLNFQQGCFGNPAELDTLVTFWTRMEKLHYPGAADMKSVMEEKRAAQQAAQMMAQQTAMRTEPMGGAVMGADADLGEMSPAGAAPAAAEALPMASQVGGMPV